MLRLETPRLILRPPRLADAAAIEAIASRREVAEMTASVPHPYPKGGAAQFIAGLAEPAAHGADYHVIIERRADGAIIGMAGLYPAPAAPSGQIGYYIAPDCWGQGYATEAAGRLLRYATDNLRLPRVTAHVFLGNTASLRVLEKLGFARLREIERDLPLRGGLRRIHLLEYRG
jgi:[ribosomal protein S5]-alanine N-acetyltransferase